VKRLLAFVRLSRPLFLYGGFAGVALGAAVAAWSGRRVDVATYLWAQALVTAFHLMVHYANDYFDRECDAGTTRTAWSGGSGILVTGELHPRVALVAALACAALGLAVCARFALAGNPTVALIGIGILVFAWCYSAPPVRLAARRLGEIDTVLVVAVLVPCAGYAAFAGRIDDPILSAVLAPAGAMFAMMLCVQLPDANSDFLAGKRNLVVAWGPARAWQLIMIAACFAVATAVTWAVKQHAGIATLALAPAAVCAFALVRYATGDPRPASMAFWGITLYATTVTGLAAVYALLAVSAAR
jgi:1,4-dihydroxy-2-naphthoate octaprenyltransferase